MRKNWKANVTARLAASVVAVALVAGVLAPRAHAEDKNIIALQQMVTLLMNRVADLQRDFNTSVGMLQGLVSQNTDTVNKLSSSLANIQSNLSGGQVVASQQQQDIAKQFQLLSDSIADLQARMGKMDTTLQQIHQMQQTIPAPAPGSTPAAGDPFNPGGAPAATGTAPASGPTPALAAYQTALADFQANSPAAQRELATFLRTYPSDAQVPDAAYYLGTLLMNKQQYNEAINAFNQVIVQYPDNEKAPQAELNKGLSLAKMGNRTDALAELRAVAKNYPGTTAARQAVEEINRLKKQ